MRLWLLPLVILLLPAGCGVTLPEEGELQLLVDPRVDDSGQLRATFLNTSSQTVNIGFLECMTTVERLDHQQWLPVEPREGGQVCILPEIPVEPRQSYHYRTRAPVEPGTYRLVAGASVEGNRPDLPGGGTVTLTVCSAPFQPHIGE